MVLCGTWSETSVAQSQLTQFWQIPRHRTLSYSLWTPFFVIHDYPLAVEPGSTPRPLVQKKSWRDSLPIDMLLSAVSVLVVAQSSSDIPEGLMNNPVLLQFLSVAGNRKTITWSIIPLYSRYTDWANPSFCLGLICCLYLSWIYLHKIFYLQLRCVDSFSWPSVEYILSWSKDLLTPTLYKMRIINLGPPLLLKSRPEPVWIVFLSRIWKFHSFRVSVWKRIQFQIRHPKNTFNTIFVSLTKTQRNFLESLRFKQPTSCKNLLFY